MRIHKLTENGVQYHINNKIKLHENIFRFGSDAYFRLFKEARELYNKGLLKDLDVYDEEILRDTQLGEWVNLKGIGRVPLDMIIDEENDVVFSEGVYMEKPEQNMLKGFDAKTQAQLVQLKAKYPQADNLLSALLADVVKTKTTDMRMDKHHDEKLKDLDKRIKDIEQQMKLKEAEYQGKKVSLSKPKRGGSKKFYVYVMNPKTKKVKKVSFGAAGGGGSLAVKLKDPKARKAFADRHNCDQKNDKTKPGYWSCRLPRYAKSLGLSGGGTWW